MARRPTDDGDRVTLTFDEFFETRQVGKQCFTCTNCTKQALDEIRGFVEKKKAGESKASIRALYEYLVRHHGFPPGIGKLENHLRGCLGM